MALKAGIVGLPNVGKSTLFNAITKQKILAANYPFATIEPNVGIVLVPDKRLEKLAEIYRSKKIIPTAYEFTDIAGLVKGSSKGEGLGNKFLAHIREVDAIVEVVRCFEDRNITHVEEGTDPIRDIEIIDLELSIADLDTINFRIEKIRKKAEATKETELIFEYETLKKAQEYLISGLVLRNVVFKDEEKHLLRQYHLLSMKPVIYVANVSEKDLNKTGNQHLESLKSHAKKEESKVIVLSAKLEEELADLDEESKQVLLGDFGIEESGLDSLTKVTYDLLGLETFFTAGEPETRAWTFQKGSNAKKCAGIIHSDFEKGFIKAEVISYEDLISFGDEQKVKEAGKLRLEGKNYLMKDGDICHFRFNV